MTGRPINRETWPASFQHAARLAAHQTIGNTDGLSGVYTAIRETWDRPDLGMPNKDYVKAIVLHLAQLNVRQAMSVEGIQGRGPAIIVTTYHTDELLYDLRKHGKRPTAAWPTPTKRLHAVLARGPPEVRPENQEVQP